MNKFLKKSQKGFTLIEILVVIGIIAILAAVVIIAINPARQFAQARNSQRQANIESILNALGQNMADNKGILNCAGATIVSSSTNIGTNANLINLSCLTPTYLPAGVPTDPLAVNGGDTLYTVGATSSRYIVCAPQAANETALTNPTSLCVTR